MKIIGGFRGEKMEKKQCPYCGKIVKAGNFCSNCGKKLVEVCQCKWLQKPYNCGKAECPGSGIFFITKPEEWAKIP